MDDSLRYQSTPDILIKAMQGEQDAIVYYEQLQRMAPDKRSAELIGHIRADEIKHWGAFGNLYARITGQYPSLPYPKTPQIASFIDGVEQSILDELEAYEFYRDVFLTNPSAEVRIVFLEALTDENEHAAKHNYMFTKTLNDRRSTP